MIKICHGQGSRTYTINTNFIYTAVHYNLLCLGRNHPMPLTPIAGRRAGAGGRNAVSCQMYEEGELEDEEEMAGKRIRNMKNEDVLENEELKDEEELEV